MIQRRADHGDFEAGGKWRAGFQALPRTWNEQRELLQVACEVWGHGCLDGVADEGDGGLEPPPEADVCRDEHAERFAEGSPLEKSGKAISTKGDGRDHGEGLACQHRVGVPHVSNQRDVLSL